MPELCRPELVWSASHGWSCSVCLAGTDVVHDWPDCARYAVARANELHERTVKLHALALDYLGRVPMVDTERAEQMKALEYLR